MEELFLKATVTGKRQITIPKELCELLNIRVGQQVIFKKENNKILFEVESEFKSCFACDGTGVLDKNPCFICNETGYLDKNVYLDIYKLIGVISLNSINFNININFTPEFKVTSKVYTKETLAKIENEIQKRINKQLK